MSKVTEIASEFVSLKKGPGEGSENDVYAQAIDKIVLLRRMRRNGDAGLWSGGSKAEVKEVGSSTFMRRFSLPRG